MTLGAQSQGKFIATDIAEIAGGPDTADHVTDFTSQDLNVWDLDTIYVQCKVTGTAGNTAVCSFKFVVSVDGTNWTTEYFVELEITMSGANAIVKGWHLNVLGIHSIRLQQIENKEAGAGAKALLLNVQWGKSYGSDRW